MILPYASTGSYYCSCGTHDLFARCISGPQLRLQCRLSWLPLTYRGPVNPSRHLREQTLQVFAHFAPFWPLQSLRLSQVSPSALLG